MPSFWFESNGEINTMTHFTNREYCPINDTGAPAPEKIPSRALTDKE